MTESYVRKVEALLTRANHPETPPEEREACLDKADKIMASHRLDRAMLFQSGKGPTKEIKIDVIERIQQSEFSGQINSLRNQVYEHCGCLTHIDKWPNYRVYGYEEDIYFANVLWTSIYMDLVRRAFPVWERARSFDDNVYEMKNAGYSWPQVRDAGLLNDARDANGPLTEKNAGSKLRTAYKRAAAARGVTVLPGKQQPLKPDQWRKAFIESYVVTLQTRLWALEREAKEHAGKEGEIALQTDADRVRNRFWQDYPEEHPEAVARRAQEMEAIRQEHWDNMTPKERARAERQYDARVRRLMKEGDRERSSSAYVNGSSAGRRAANEVDLGRGDKVAGASRKEIG